MKNNDGRGFRICSECLYEVDPNLAAAETETSDVPCMDDIGGHCEHQAVQVPWTVVLHMQLERGIIAAVPCPARCIRTAGSQVGVVRERDVVKLVRHDFDARVT